MTLNRCSKDLSLNSDLRLQFHELFPVCVEIQFEREYHRVEFQVPKKKKVQIDFLFLEQENCHMWQIAAGWFPWAWVFRVSTNPISPLSSR